MSIAAFITVFSLVASRALISQRSYQSRVITQKKQTLTQLKANNQAAGQLVNAYKVFVSQSVNIIGGNSTGVAGRDGDNATIVLDALPSKYDFPALATSLEKILSDKSVSTPTFSGSDDELNQAKQSGAGTVKPVEIPITIGFGGSADTVQSMLDTFQRSIRPIKISTISFSGTDTNLGISLTATTYYQPEKKVNITTKDVK
ncbi:MAG TPA: hypothetical protein VLE69_03750 [Candidatus Saccharimonadales bacterium]|nr:hypothetical protein [Candidatus Saccharimonadales bacterium]